MLEERPYQLDGCRGVWKNLFILNHPSCLLQAGTGLGKTVIFSFFVQRYLQFQQRPVLFMVHRREIVDQTAKKLRGNGIACGVIMADRPYQPWESVQVASVDSLDAWIARGKIGLPDAGLICIDEAHRAMGKRYQDLIEVYQEECDAKLMGMTATPVRADGVGLGRSFKSMYQCPGIQWSIDHGWLVPVQYKVGIIPDLKGVKITANNYNQAQLEAVMDQRLLIGDIVENWMLYGRGRPTMAFCSGVKHSQHVVEEFLKNGIRAEHIDHNTPLDVRDGLSERLLTGETQVVCNAQVYVEGTDIPWISCIILAKPDKSVGPYLQKAGRGLRPWLETGKRDLLVLDHAGDIYRHGRIELERTWILTEGSEMEEIHRSERDKEQVKFTCIVCRTQFTGTCCPNCNQEVKFTGRAAAFLPATLADLAQAEFDALENPKAPLIRIERKSFFQQLLGYAEAKGYSPGWAYHKYIDKFKEPPRFGPVEAMEVSRNVRTWINGQIAHTKIREKARAKKAGQ